MQRCRSVDDLDHMMAVMETAFDPHWGEAWNRKQLSDTLLLPTTHYTIVSASGSAPANGDAAKGFALTRSAPGEEELLLIGVSPDARGRGLGSQLLSHCIAEARDRRADRLFLEMRDGNEAVALYGAHGFEPIGRRKAYYRASDGTRIDAITFARQL